MRRKAWRTQGFGLIPSWHLFVKLIVRPYYWKLWQTVQLMILSIKNQVLFVLWINFIHGTTFLFACIVMEKAVRVVRHMASWGGTNLSAIGWSKELIRRCSMENVQRGEQEGRETRKWLNLLALSSCLSRSWWTHLAFVQLICAVQKSPSSPLRDNRHLPVSCFLLTTSCQTLAKLIRHTDRSLWQNKGDISKKEWW